MQAAAVLRGVLVQNITCDVEEVNADQVNEAIVSAPCPNQKLALQVQHIFFGLHCSAMKLL